MAPTTDRRTLEFVGGHGRRRRSTSEQEHIPLESTPPVMWPEEGSGFDADPFSPAGMSQQIWRATGYRAQRPMVRRLIQVVALLLALAFIVAQVAH